MNATTSAERLGDMMMSAAHQWLDCHETEDDEGKTVGVVVSFSPVGEGNSAFVVGSTHDIAEDALVEILLTVVNNLLPPESQMRLMVTPKIAPKGQG